MNFTQRLLTLAKTNQGGASDYRIAKLMGVSCQTISNYKNGRQAPNDNMFALAELAGLNPIKILLSYNLMHETDDNMRLFWEDIFSKRFPNETPVFSDLQSSEDEPNEVA